MNLLKAVSPKFGLRIGFEKTKIQKSWNLGDYGIILRKIPH